MEHMTDTIALAFRASEVHDILGAFVYANGSLALAAEKNWKKDCHRVAGDSSKSD